MTIRCLAVFTLSALAAAAYADPPGRVARLNHISGAVSFAPAEAPAEWTQAVINRPLTNGDRLWVDRGARGELHVGSTAVRLASLTSLDLLHLDDDRLQLRLAQGTANVRVRDLDSNDVVEIATPAGAVVLRQAGSYRVSVDPQSHAVRVVVNSGEAALATPTQSYSVPAGQAAVVAPGTHAAFEVAAYAPADEFDRWSAERDRREDAVASTRYVSPHMTGYEDLDGYGSWRTLSEYGAVWMPARVGPDWAPYRDGHWEWISPWGWTWIDDAPWGFAPFHYGRWVRVHDRWGWAPGPVVRRPVYAPALVAFVGSSNWSVSLHSGPAVGWFPLGWREPYRPWYRASHAHVRHVNHTHVTNVHETHVRHVHRNRPDAVTVVPRQAFVSSGRASRSRFHLAEADLARAEVLRDRSPAERVRAAVPTERRARETPTPRERGAGFARDDARRDGRDDAQRDARVSRRQREEPQSAQQEVPAAAAPTAPVPAPAPAETRQRNAERREARSFTQHESARPQVIEQRRAQEQHRRGQEQSERRQAIEQRRTQEQLRRGQEQSPPPQAIEQRRAQEQPRRTQEQREPRQVRERAERRLDTAPRSAQPRPQPDRGRERAAQRGDVPRSRAPRETAPAPQRAAPAARQALPAASAARGAAAHAGAPRARAEQRQHDAAARAQRQEQRREQRQGARTRGAGGT